MQALFVTAFASAQGAPRSPAAGKPRPHSRALEERRVHHVHRREPHEHRPPAAHQDGGALGAHELGRAAPRPAVAAGLGLVARHEVVDNRRSAPPHPEVHNPLRSPPTQGSAAR